MLCFIVLHINIFTLVLLKPSLCHSLCHSFITFLHIGYATIADLNTSHQAKKSDLEDQTIH